MLTAALPGPELGVGEDAARGGAYFPCPRSWKPHRCEMSDVVSTGHTLIFLTLAPKPPSHMIRIFFISDVSRSTGNLSGPQEEGPWGNREGVFRVITLLPHYQELSLNMPRPGPPQAVEPASLTPWALHTILEINSGGWPGRPRWTALCPVCKVLTAAHTHWISHHQQHSAKHFPTHGRGSACRT